MTRQASGKLNFGGYPLGNAAPTGWVMSSLGEIAEDVRSGFASGEHNEQGEGIPHLRPMNINAQGSIDLSQVRYVAPERGSLRLRRGDILFNNTNSQVWVGKTAFVQEDTEFAFSNHMTRIRVNQEVVNSEFIARQLHFLATSGYFQLHCKRHVNQASVASGVLEETVPLLIPPRNELKRIVHRVHELQLHTNRAWEAQQAIPDLLDQLRQSVLAAAFRGDLTKKWREEHPDVEPASELLKRIRIERRKRWEEAELEKLKAKGLTGEKLDSEFANRRRHYKEPEPVSATGMSELPKGWCWATVDELGIVVRGASPRPAGDRRYFGGRVPWITVGHLTADENPYLSHVDTTLTEAGKERSRYIEEETLLMTNSGATLGVPKITKVGGCINDGIAAILHIQYPTKLFLHYFLVTQTVPLRRINQGAAQPNLNTEIIRKISVPLAPLSEQQEIVKIIEHNFQRIQSERKFAQDATSRLSRLDHAILTKAFRGGLVSQDPNDEPASMLLERIKAERARKFAKDG